MINGLTANYYLDGSTILAEERLNSSGIITDFIYYVYDITGVAGFIHTKNSDVSVVSAYYYVKNALNDITTIIDSSGTKVAEYVYDAFGKLITARDGNGSTVSPTDMTKIVNLNPFRYRSYYWDFETGFYYLQTRYYDPSIRRFISKDSVSLLPELAQVIGQLNLYAYCNNNPVAYTDETGELILSLIIGIVVTTLVCGAISGLTNTITALATGQDAWAAFVGGFINGAICGLGVGIGLATGGIGGLAIAGILGYVGGHVGHAVEMGMSTGTYDWSLKANYTYGLFSAMANMITFGITSAFLKAIEEPLVGTFIQRLSQALAPTAESFVFNMIYGGVLSLTGTLGGIAAYYIHGGRYGKSQASGIFSV